MIEGCEHALLSESPRRRRLGVALLAASLLLLLLAGLRGLSDPWEEGMRGGVAAYYSDGVVTHTLRYGLGVTLGMPAFITETADGFDRGVNWHHPPLYWLYLTLSAWLFGHTPAVLRLAQLLLFLPGLLALFALVRRRAGSWAAGCVALLFASSPLVAYFGPMVLQDGAVLSVGLLATWCFDRHLLGVGRRWLGGAAGCYLLACLFDFSGYWWGAVMFVLAIGTPRRRRGLLAVAAMFVVSLAAFAITAVHYGIELGGPLGYLRALFGALGADGTDVAVSTPRIERAVRELLIAFGNWPLLAAAALGVLLAALPGVPRGRQLLLLGVALVLPGVMNVAAMFSHALNHVFWSLHGFGGLAVLGAVLPVAGLAWLGRSLPQRGVGVVLLVAAAGVVVGGVVVTHRVATHFAYVDRGTHAVMQKALPLLDGCSNALTSAPEVPQKFFGSVSTWGGIDTPEKLELVLELGRRGSARGQVGVVVAPWHHDTPLTRLLDSRAERLVADDVWVYRLQL